MADIIWRGLSFSLSPESHRGYERWGSERLTKYGRELWVAECFAPGEMWCSRLLVDNYRITGDGPNMLLALDAALNAAKDLRQAIGKALPK